MSQSPASPPLDGLLDLACRDGVDIRPTLLRVLTDLYVQKATHTAYEETQYVELALGLIQSADEPTRAAVHASLRDYAGAPKAVLEALGGQLAPPTPRPMAEAMQEIAQAMAQEMARRSEPEPKPAPPAAVPDDLVEVFFSASASDRRLVLANLDVVDGPRLRPLAAAHETVAQLEIAALQRKSDAFCRTLMRDLGLDRRLAERIVHDDLGEGLVVVAKAIGMKAAVLHRILLFLNPAIGQSVDRVYDLANLFDEISAQAAAHLLSTWTKPVARKQPVHAPVLYDDERRRARPASSTTRAGERPAQPGALKTNSR